MVQPPLTFLDDERLAHLVDDVVKTQHLLAIYLFGSRAEGVVAAARSVPRRSGAHPEGALSAPRSSRPRDERSTPASPLSPTRRSLPR
jgi:hypothetical protein